MGIVPRFRADIADLDLRLDDGGRVQCFSDCASYEPWTLTMDGAIW